jgi:type IV secretory pathway VirB2 component (pilin)
MATAEEIDGILSAVLLERPHYAKFHASLARLESLRGKHQDAQRFLSRAMELEDPASKDFNLRMVSYNQILSRIVMRESLSTVASETQAATIAAHQAHESVKSFVDQMQTRYLELLGIFSAIIGIVLTGVQVAAGMDFADGARLMLMVTGSILIVFSAITAVLQRPMSYMLALGGLGVLLIAGGFAAGILN